MQIFFPSYVILIIQYTTIYMLNYLFRLELGKVQKVQKV
jgi:hypothetical protein